jgi:uncharacterized membrane protein
MVYLWLKALHITAVVVWVGGLFAAAFMVATARNGALGRTDALEAIRRWDQRVTAPALLVVWGAGLTLAMQGGWFPARWLIVKLAVVVLLSALHGILSGSLRRLAQPDAVSLPSWMHHAPLLIVGGVTAIVLLVVVKPI